MQSWNASGIGGSFDGSISFTDIDFSFVNKDTWNLSFTLKINHSSFGGGGGTVWTGSVLDSYNMQITSYNGTISYPGNNHTVSYKCSGAYVDNTVTITLSNAIVY